MLVSGPPQESSYKSFYSAFFSPFAKEMPELDADPFGLVKVLSVTAATSLYKDALQYQWSVLFRSAPPGTPLDLLALPDEKGWVVCSNTVYTKDGALEELNALVALFRDALKPKETVTDTNLTFRRSVDPPIGWTARGYDNRIILTQTSLDLKESERTGKTATMKREVIIEKVSKEVVAELEKLLKAFENKVKSN